MRVPIRPNPTAVDVQYYVKQNLWDALEARGISWVHITRRLRFTTVNKLFLNCIHLTAQKGSQKVSCGQVDQGAYDSAAFPGSVRGQQRII